MRGESFSPASLSQNCPIRPEPSSIPPPFPSQAYLSDGVGAASVCEDSGGRAESGDGSHNLGGVGDILEGRDASGDGEDSGSGELHFDVGYLLMIRRSVTKRFCKFVASVFCCFLLGVFGRINE